MFRTVHYSVALSLTVAEKNKMIIHISSKPNINFVSNVRGTGGFLKFFYYFFAFVITTRFSHLIFLRKLYGFKLVTRILARRNRDQMYAVTVFFISKTEWPAHI